MAFPDVDLESLPRGDDRAALVAARRTQSHILDRWNSLRQVEGATPRLRSISLSVLDLTGYEPETLSSAGESRRRLSRSRGRWTQLDELAGICPQLEPSTMDMREAARSAGQHDLTLYGVTYAAVARARDGELATMDKALFKAGLGRRPSEIVALADRGEA